MADSVIGMNPGHDGAIAGVREGVLEFSIEGEKDSFPRYSALGVHSLQLASEYMSSAAEVVAVGGWYKYLPGFQSRQGMGYHGLSPGRSHRARFLGTDVTYYETSHERCHLFASAALAPFAPVERASILVWEGDIGAVYTWSDYGRKISRHAVLRYPGGRYASLYGLADPTFPDVGADPPHEAAGKLMALAAYSDRAPTPEEARTVDWLLASRYVYPMAKHELRDSPLYNCGVHTPRLHSAARYMSDRIFDRFLQTLERECLRDEPLLVGGGCGLNCEWNSRLRSSGLFSEVFVPPCPNDSGVAIGAAADALSTVLRRPLRVEWSVYSGPEFLWDGPPPTDWLERRVDFAQVARRISEGAVVAWVDGRAEIGPRALGHRSLLADPRSARNLGRLNSIKQRESYRPIAPCCLAHKVGDWFSSDVDPEVDKYMLYFSRVTSTSIPAVTHVDGSARVQTVDVSTGNLYKLLNCFLDRTGVPVLCNTSLNFPGHGFINRSSELFAYVSDRDVSDVVVDDRWFTRSVD